MTLPNDFRDRLPELLDERAPPHAPEGLFERFAERMEDAPQRPGWATSERWFPMPTRALDGQLRRTMLFIGAALLLVLALAATVAVGSQLLASERTIIIAADGSGDVTTLGEGVAMARDGDTILVRPGTYVESVTITRNLLIRGDGDRDSIVISAPGFGPTIETGALASRPVAVQQYAILIDGSDPTLSNLTFSGEPSAVVAIGGAPILTANRFEGVGVEQPDQEAGRNAIAILGGSRAIIQDNLVVDSGPIASYDLSVPVIERNVLTGGAHILGGFGDAAEIRGNHVEWASWGIESRGDAAPRIEGNTITEVGTPIHAELGSAIIRGNTIEHGASPEAGIRYEGGSGTVAENTIKGYARGVVATDFDGTISDNTIDSGFEGLNLTDSTGIVIDNQIMAVFSGITLSRSSPNVVGNRIEGSINGVTVVGESSAPTFSGNELCQTTKAVATSDGATEPDVSGLGDCTEA